MTPSFRHMGGKARLRKWLVRHFPVSGNCYVEPFCGKANVFFYAHQFLQFRYWKLSDLDVEFLRAVLFADLDQLPDVVGREEFSSWKTRDDLLAKLLEPRITFAGKGYKYGYSGSSGTHIGYSRSSYLPLCEEARRSLRLADIRAMEWQEALCVLREHDFAYIDPPYFGTSSNYANIDHLALVQQLNRAEFKWALSGYDNGLYDQSLKFVSKISCERNSEIKSSNKRGFSSVTETLWMNYWLPPQPTGAELIRPL